MVAIDESTLQRMKKEAINRCKERIVAAKRNPSKTCKEEDLGTSSILKRKHGI